MTFQKLSSLMILVSTLPKNDCKRISIGTSIEDSIILEVGGGAWILCEVQEVPSVHNELVELV